MIAITEDLLRRLLDGDKLARQEARSLLPEPEKLFGRWATHKKYGRVLCISLVVSSDNTVHVLAPGRSYLSKHGAIGDCVNVDSLTFDPTELVTEQDFRDAPEGTIVVADYMSPHVKRGKAWYTTSAEVDNQEMAKYDPWQVLRWGKGE